LVDGEWIDRYTVALAEWGGRLIRKGFVLEDPEDNHPMAWYRIVDPSDGSDADAAETQKLWQQTMRHLPKFPGRTREIDGQSYLSFSDYRKWRGRRARWDLKSGCREGIAVIHWNQWVEAHSDDAPTVADVKVGKLNCHSERVRLHICPGSEELEEEVGRRKSLLESLRVRKSGSGSGERFDERARSWKRLTETFVLELYTLRQAIDTIGRRYFDGHQALFPGAVEVFDQLVDHAEQLVGFYNEDLANRLESQVRLLGETESEKPEARLVINLAGLIGKIGEPANAEADYLVDMAKAEALSLMGETKKGLEFADRHIRQADTITK
jgi:hypothetical protein